MTNASPRGLWRDGSRLVISRQGTEMPPFCVKTNLPATRKVRVLLQWFPLGKFLGGFPGSLVTVLRRLVSTRTEVDLWISDRAVVERRWRIVYALLFSILSPVASIGGWLVLDSALASPAGSQQAFYVGIAGFFAFMLAMVLGAVLAFHFRLYVGVSTMDEHSIWLRGVHPDYLARCEPWQGPRPDRV